VVPVVRCLSLLLEVLTQEIQQVLQLLLLGLRKSRHHKTDVPGQALQDAFDEVPTGGGQTYLTCAGVVMGDGSCDQGHFAEAVDHSRCAGGLDEQTLAEVPETQARDAIGFGSLQGPQDAPLRSADAELQKEWLHRRPEDAAGTQYGTEGGFGLRARGILWDLGRFESHSVCSMHDHA
jgi:hypothetical protein